VANNIQPVNQVFCNRRHLIHKYSLSNPGNRFNFDHLRQHIERGLKTTYPDLTSITMLDIGSGGLSWTEEFVKLGISREKCIALDLLQWRLEEGHDAGRDIKAVCASAAELPFSDGVFDLVTQLTLMTSVLEANTREAIVSEMKRVLRPGGYILWYDFRFNNPINRHTRAIGRREIEKSFDGWKIRIEKMTLLPPLARRFNDRWSVLLKFFYAFPILRTHYLAVIGPKG